ncbi:hypothetical protein [Flagellimonas lutimaris]|uniref:hypothetical protein n=1 Tax=Flagellimonas lutimaris TaxID=475082 RepID=UPI003F5CF264
MNRTLWTFLTLLVFPLGIYSQNPAYFIAEKTDSTAAYLNLKNTNGFWHLSGPRSYEANNKFSIFWNNGTYHRYFSILDDGKIGIGTDSPLTQFHVNGRGITLNRDDSQYGQFIDFTRNGILAWQIHAGINIDESFNIRNGTSSSKLTILQSGNVGIGTTSPDAKLTVNGTIHSKEVKVDLSVPGPDYVFKEGYDLKSLEEVQNYVKEFGHLPNIPSAEDMEKNGVELGVMNMKLLEKIEELTLYTLQLNRENKELANSLELERGKVEKLGKRLEKLEQDIIINRNK